MRTRSAPSVRRRARGTHGGWVQGAVLVAVRVDGVVRVLEHALEAVVAERVLRRALGRGLRVVEQALGHDAVHAREAALQRDARLGRLVQLFLDGLLAVGVVLERARHRLGLCAPRQAATNASERPG